MLKLLGIVPDWMSYPVQGVGYDYVKNSQKCEYLLISKK